MLSVPYYSVQVHESSLPWTARFETISQNKEPLSLSCFGKMSDHTYTKITNRHIQVQREDYQRRRWLPLSQGEKMQKEPVLKTPWPQQDF